MRGLGADFFDKPKFVTFLWNKRMQEIEAPVKGMKLGVLGEFSVHHRVAVVGPLGKEVFQTWTRTWRVIFGVDKYEFARFPTRSDSLVPLKDLIWETPCLMW